MNLRIFWNGLFWKNNLYEVWGELTSSWDAETINFLPVGANEKTQELVFWGELAGKTIDVVKKSSSP